MIDLEEPLAESAPIAWEMAPRLCRLDPATGERCDWYHGLWPFLRIMGLTSSAAQRAGFYHRSMEAAGAGAGTPRVLISGTADYAMLAVVMGFFRGRHVRPAITVTDLCETPLQLSRWYAARESVAIETVCGDLLEWRTAERFDFICTDGFFSRFPAARRPALVARWRELLRPGGRVITTNRLHPGRPDARTGFSAARSRAFLDSVRGAIEEKRDALRVDPQALMQQAEIYAARHDTWPLASMEEVRATFEDAGFGIDTLEAISRARKQPEEAGAAPRKPVMQMHLVATLRQAR